MTSKYPVATGVEEADDDVVLLLPKVGNFGKSKESGGNDDVVPILIPNNSTGWMDTESNINPIRLGAGCFGIQARVCTLARIKVFGGGIFNNDERRDDGNNGWNRGIKSMILVTVVVVVVLLVVPDGAFV